MRLLVTGAGGMLGRDVLAAAAAAGHDAVPATRAELDVTDADATQAHVAAGRFDAIVNCAAYTDVDGTESDEAAALAVNGIAAGHLARAATAVGAHLVHVSTDYVFDGTKTTPYVESDPVGPRSAYGRTKLAGEDAIAGVSPEHAVVRTAWLYGAGGPNFVATMLRLADDRDEVSVVTDQLGCPTWTGHLAPVLVQIAERRQAGVQHAAGDGAVSWNGFAQAIFAEAGRDCRVLPTTTDHFPRPAPRPAFSVLGSERADHIALPPWRDGLRAHLAAQAIIGETT
jgi:dTDP-4-dehydrorhamnose reductase